MTAMKRIAALLMAFCLCFQLVPAPAGAAETAAITVSDAEVYPGSGCYVYVDAAGLSDLASLDLEIYYDSDVLTLSYISHGELLSGSLASINDDTAGVVKLSAAWLSGVSGGGQLLMLFFETKTNAAAGTYRVLAAVGDAHDVQLNHVNISGDTGSITVLPRPNSMGTFYMYMNYPDGTVFQQGDTVRMTLCSGGFSFASADFKLEYDSDLFRLESVQLRDELTVEGAVYSVNTGIEGMAKISYASVASVTPYFMMDFVLTVTADTDTQSIFTVSASDVYTVELIPYNPYSTSDTVTLEKKMTKPDYPDLWLSDLPDKVGEEGTSLLILEEGAGVAAADFTVKYDPAVYQCLGVTAAESLSENGGMVVINPKFDGGTIKFSYINENGLDCEMELVEIQWKCLASPAEHTQVQTGGTGIVDADFASVKLDAVSFTGCVYDIFRVKPTCTSDGEEGLICLACGEKKDVAVIPATGHHYGTVVTPPTCTEPGFTTYTCFDCGHSYVGSYTNALGHDYEPVVTAPTCTEQGYTTHTCSRCGDTYSDTYVAAQGHRWDDGTVTKNPTEEEKGEILYVCTACGVSETRILPELGHEHRYSAVVTVPTCTEQGYTTYTCRCGDIIIGDYTAALGHSYHSVVTEPTCETSGFTTHTCSRCGDSYTDGHTGALGHNYELVVTNPTCTEQGYTTHTCSRCGDTFTDAYTAALGHSWDEGTVTREPTEEEMGEIVFVCTACGISDTKILPELGHEHSYSAVVTDPTCTEQGYITYTCRCGDTFVDYYAGALGHSYESWVTEPTCEAPGFITYICIRCGDSYVGDSVPALGHTELAFPRREANCTEPGLTEGAQCAVCGMVFREREEIPALGHDYIDGTCSRCGEKDPNHDRPQPVLSGVIRIAGADRIGTSLMLADQLKETLGVEKFDSVIVASALNFPDALTGSYLAAVKSAPILLTYEAAHGKIQAYIEANLKHGGTVYILGGESAVSADFENVLKAMGIRAKRVAGTDRFGTNLAIMQEAGVSVDQPVLIATALNFADSLSASAAGLPMVLVYGSLRPDQKEFLATTSKNFIIIGGTAAVSEELEAELRALGSVTRLAGNGRYETSVMVARKFVPDPDAVVLAYARNFPDGLCGGPLAYALNAPLILTDNIGPGDADAYVAGMTSGVVVGGGALISDGTARDIFDLAADAVITAK